MPLSETNPEFEALLDYLKHYRGCDLTGYKRSTLMRRFQHRMHNIQIDNYQSYLQYLQSHSDEYRVLLNDVLINVTCFFRDRDAWDYLATDVIPKILAAKQPNEPIRVWSAGCAGGQEIYSLLILLAEALGIETCLQQVQCFATDSDEDALQQARYSTYSYQEITDIPADWLEKYFIQTEQGYVFHTALRRTIVFGRHDLAKHAPMSKIDLLICRNVLIYFNPDVQAAILVRFHFSLKNTGFLFLGRAETLTNQREIFRSVHTKHRIYTRDMGLSLQDHLSISPKPKQAQTIEPPIPQNYFWKAAFDTSPAAQIAVDCRGYVVEANEQANFVFGLTLDDWNRPFQELKPGELLKPHISIDILLRNRHSIIVKDIEWVTTENTKYFDIAIAPVSDPQKQFMGITLTFLDKTDYKQLTKKLEHTSAELEQISEIYQTTQTELEAANQEIQLLTENILDKD